MKVTASIVDLLSPFMLFADGKTQIVSQTLCSAISCAYGSLPLELWEPLATVVLDAAYEVGSEIVYLQT